MMAPAPHLRELIETVQTDAGSGDALDQLAVAAETAGELSQLGDRLLGHYVENARQQGRSWIEISETLGVTKQAVHKRFAASPGWKPTMERFTQRLKAVIDAAEVAAKDLRHQYIGTEHLLLGLYAEPEAIAGRILLEAGLTREQVEAAVVAEIERGTSPVEGQLPYTPRASKVFERTLEAALEWGHNYLGTEHLLVGLYGDEASVAGRILTANAPDKDVVKGKIVEILSAYRQK